MFAIQSDESGAWVDLAYTDDLLLAELTILLGTAAGLDPRRVRIIEVGFSLPAPAYGSLPLPSVN